MKRPLLAALLLCLAGSALASDLDDARDYLRQRQYDQALRSADAYLASHAQDADGMVVKAVILGQLGRTAEAIRLDEEVIRTYPALLEPRNNLAVLYASLGQYEKAREALEAALRTHPSYATAYDNLGEVYNRMASLAYDKALGEPKKTDNPVSVLSVLTDTRASATRAQEAPKMRLAVTLPGRAFAPEAIAAPSTTMTASAEPAAKPAPAQPAEPPKPAPAAQAKPAPQPPAPAPQKPSVLAQAEQIARIKLPLPPAKPVPPPAKPAPIPTKPAEPPAKPVPPPEKPAKPAKEPDESGAVVEAVNSWAKAWSAKNSSAYLGYYARDFKPPKGDTRGSWEKTRRERIAAPKSIKVGISGAKVHMKDSSHASITFRQSYEAGALKNSTTKTLEMVRSGKRWLIVEERIGK